MRLPLERFLPLALLAVAACAHTSADSMPGTLEWDRIAVLAEVSEPVIALDVKEGDAVRRGQLLLRLDPRRTDAELAAARADAARLAANLDELRHGARIETIDADRAQLARAESDAANAQRVRDRAAALRQQGLNAQADLDNAETSLRMARAVARAARAQLDELLHGTRPEDIAQAEAALAAARAQAEALQVKRARLDVRAPRNGRVDALPYRLGDQPATGGTLASLLAGDAPYARVYVPERLRAGAQPGQHYRVHVDGVAQPFDAVLRSVRSDPAFTPYYALSGEDAGRLVYRAELVLQGDAARALPAGLPCRAERVGDERP
ncbi:MAG: HlyD family efflux transporter periplasmic adaptor subunit [Mizugakiibacter sp.]|uniref:HlyD family secretion protein n=1 Tax=Mizugakiibacter sp. TaxID=1972610 RepID=UPI0031C94003|nr:HlyD family efflux transporter periplasmic adaptor subunit [Xanthomonadaceae bacterium]